MPEELQGWEKRFSKKFLESSNEVNYVWNEEGVEDIKLFIAQEIERAKAEERERVFRGVRDLIPSAKQTDSPYNNGFNDCRFKTLVCLNELQSEPTIGHTSYTGNTEYAEAQVKKSCLNLDCPERKGGECNAGEEKV